MMPDKGLTTEFELSIAILRYLDTTKGEVPLDSLRKAMPDHIALTEADQTPSTKRAGTQKWEDQLDAIIANKDADANFISRGFFFHRPLRLAITESGRFFLHDRILRK